jgi:cyclophilin family peptidyl-prolyl cis-trans isomerase
MTAKKSSGSRQRSRPAEPKKANPNVKTIIILAVIAIVIVVAVSVLYMLSNTDGNQNNGDIPEGNSIAVIDTSMGTIKVELYEDKVPNTCENFIKLANDGFYDDLVFHRVKDDFMIQGGGFTSDGTNKESPYGAIDLEINPEVRHVDGAIAMARTNDPNSATSQFYICDGAQSFLDDNYAAFGIVIDGMDVLRNIASVGTSTKNGMNDWPVDDVTINSITIESQ